MGGRRSRRRGSGGPSRRTVLGGLGLGVAGIGAASLALGTGAYDSVDANRTTNVSTVDDPDAIVGLLINEEVRKKKRELLADVTNDTGEDLSVTFSLDNPSQGTLVGPDGGSGDSVTFSLADMHTTSVHIEASVDGTISFTITASSNDFEFDATRETEAVSGNTDGAVEIEKLQHFRANANEDTWTIDRVKAVSNVGSNDLDRAEYEVADSSGDVVGTRTDQAGGDTYEKKRSGNDPAITIDPDAGETVQPGERYELTLAVYDDADNFDVATRTATA
jgi:hypothetical protein